MTIYLLEWHWDGSNQWDGSRDCDAGGPGPPGSDSEREYFANLKDLATRVVELQFSYSDDLHAFISKKTMRDDMPAKGLILACLNRRDYFSDDHLIKVLAGGDTVLSDAKMHVSRGTEE